MNQNESKQEKYVFFSIIAILLLAGGALFYPAVKRYVNDKLMENKIIDKRTELNLVSKTPKEYYDMFQCSCCGQPIDKGCCGMAKQRKEYVDKLLLEGLDKIFYQCTLCKACKIECPLGIDIEFEKIREELVKNKIETEANKKMINNIRKYGNPFGKIEKDKIPKELYCC